MTLEELCKRLEELTRDCDRIALEIVQRRVQIAMKRDQENQ